MNQKNALREGENCKLPFLNEQFDYLLSWNVCYYMGSSNQFQSHVSEYARVLKPGGKLTFSMPKKSCFIYKGSDTSRKGYKIIRNDPFYIRNGMEMRCFEDESDILNEFAAQFSDFTFGSIEDDGFGLAYHWHIGVCSKKI